jgi:hypothetical protein
MAHDAARICYVRPFSVRNNVRKQKDSEMGSGRQVSRDNKRIFLLLGAVLVGIIVSIQ